jgi:hypothetical protein
VKTLAQQLVEKWLKVVKTEQWHSMMSEKESLIKQDSSDNIKSDPVIHTILNAPKIDSGASSESTSDNISIDTKTKIDKTKGKIENEKVRLKKDKVNTNLKVKDDIEKIREKPKIEKEKIKDKIKDDSDDAKEKKRRLKDKNGNPFLRIIGEMTDEKSDEDKKIENSNLNLSKHASRRKQNLKNVSSGEKPVKVKLLNDSKKYNSDSNSGSDSKKEIRPLPPPAPKPKLPESKTILEKKNYSIHIEKKEYVGEKKPTVKTFKSKFRSIGLEEQPPPPPKSKAQSKKVTKNLAPLSLPKVEKRSLSPSSDSPNEKKLKSSSPSDSKKLPRKILNLHIYLLFTYFEVLPVSVFYIMAKSQILINYKLATKVTKIINPCVNKLDKLFKNVYSSILKMVLL